MLVEEVDFPNQVCDKIIKFGFWFNCFRGGEVGSRSKSFYHFSPLPSFPSRFLQLSSGMVLSISLLSIFLLLRFHTVIP